MRVSPQQAAFNTGEWSPLLFGRQDLEGYESGLATCLNAVTLVQGAWTRRGGSLFLHPTKFGNVRKSRDFEFQFNVGTTYLLEFGHLYIRFYTGGGILTQAAKTITGVSGGSLNVGSTAHGYSAGARVLITDGGGVSQITNREVEVASPGANSFFGHDIYGNVIDATGFDAYVSGGSVAEIFELTTTYTEAELDQITIRQLADVLYIFHPDHPPAKLARVSALSWTLTDLAFVDGPYFNLNATTTTLGLSGVSGSVTVTASSTTGINNGSGFLATDVGRLIRWKDPVGNWTWLEITARASTTSVTATIQGPNASAATATRNWRLGAFSDTTGFPRVGVFHEDRLWLGGVELAPQRVDGSRTQVYEDFTPTDPDGTVVDDHAVALTLAGGQLETILWLESMEKGLLAGTAGAEYVIRPSSLGEALTPANSTAKRVAAWGSEADVEPVNVGNVVLFLQRVARKLRELVYAFEDDGFRAPDLTVRAEHISAPRIIRLKYQRNPQPILWAVRSDGVLLGFTYDRAQGVISWHRHILGGVSDAAGAAPIVEDLAVLPDPNNTHDEVYLTVLRYVNGRQERYHEILTKVWETGDAQEAAFHCDCGATFTDSPAAAEIEGLWWLEGETLGVWADGAAQADVTVSNGKVTLDKAYSVKTLGYKFNSDGESLPYKDGARDGSAQGKVKRIERLGFWLMDTLGLKYGKDENSLTEILFRRWGDDWGVATPIFTGVVRERFEGDHDRLGQYFWRVDSLAPATVLATMPQGTTEDDT